MRVLIIGGVAGGATAAARLRRLDEDAEIIILERSGFVSYANCGLPYYIGGTITEREELLLQSPESFWNRYRIEVRIRHEALKIDAEAHLVTVRDLEKNLEYVQTYDKLILSPGASPVLPQIPGVRGDKIFTLRTVEDTFKIHDYIGEQQPESALIVGGGFIGLEMAENLHRRGMKITLLQRSGQVMPPFDEDMASFLHNYIRNHDIDLNLNADVKGFYEMEDRIEAEINDGERKAAHMAILAIGVMPESGLAREAGLLLGQKGAIVTDSHMRTSNPDIYAIGDVAEVRNYVTGEPAVIPLAGPANKQGRIAADHICGIPSVFRGSQGSSIMKFFDMTAASTGINAKEARARGIDFDAAILSPASHATYYPGAAAMVMKILYRKKDGRLLGGQIVGFEGVDKRIDVLAAAVRANMTAYDLTELELAYAPPYSSAKDPLNMAGYIIENLLEGRMKQVHWKEIKELPANSALLDVRTTGEYKMGHVSGTLHIPLDQLRERIGELPKEKTLYVYCQSGMRSYLACRILKKNGFSCCNVAGGYGFYQSVAADRSLEEEGKGSCGLKR